MRPERFFLAPRSRNTSSIAVYVSRYTPSIRRNIGRSNFNSRFTRRRIPLGCTIQPTFAEGLLD